MASAPTHVLVRGSRYDLPTSMTLREARDVAEAADLPLSQMEARLAAGDPRAIIAVVWDAVRRVNPKVTLERIEELDISEIEVGYP